PKIEPTTAQEYSACFYYHQRELKAAQRIPIFFGDENTLAFRKWLAEYQPDVLIGHEDIYYQTSLGMGFAFDFINLDWLGGPESGINQHRDWIVSSAVELVVAQLYRNERGIPTITRNMIIDGIWVDGSTTAKVSAPAPVKRPSRKQR